MSDYFVFGDVDSRDYSDIHVFDKSVDNTPKRVYEVKNIAGRNGAFYVDQGRYEDVEHSYGVVALTKSAGSNFINALVSQVGYHRLSDSFNEDEFYLATLTDAVKAKVSKSTRDVNTFDITFTRKPQRFLKAGEIPRVIGGDVTNTQTKSGAVVAIESDGGDAVTSLVAQIEPVQAGNGDPSPINERPITGWTSANVNVVGKNLINQRAAIDGTRTALYRDINYSNNLINRVRLEAGKTYTLSFDISCDVEPFNISVGVGRGTYSRDIRTLTNLTSGRVGITFTPTETQLANGDVLAIRAPRFNASTTFTFSITNMMLSTDGTATYEEPYKGTTHPVSFGSAGTVYGGTAELVAGVLAVTHKMVDLGTLTWTYRTNSTKPYFTTDISDLPLKSVMRCSIYKQSTLLPNNASMPDYSMSNQAYFATAHNLIIVDSRYTDAASFKAAVSGVKLVYELATPQTYQLTAQDIELLTGDNNVWVDTGDITLTYGADPNKIVNPTLFESHPLLQVWGYGEVGINDESVEVMHVPVGTIQYASTESKGGGTKSAVISKTIDTSALANTDEITVASVTARLKANKQILVGTSDITFTSGGDGEIVQNSPSTGDIAVRFTTPAFVKNTARTNTYMWRWAWTPASPSAVSFTVSVTVTVAYTTAGKIEARMSVTSDARSVVRTTNITRGDITGYSTKSALGEPLYFDLDIGEAYKYEDDSIISINNAVTIPAKLPTLKSGVNNITYDDTITQFKIVPRWWEV